MADDDDDTRDRLERLSRQVDVTSWSIFDGLIGWLRRLEGRVRRLETVVANLIVGSDADLTARVDVLEATIANLTTAIASLIPGPATQLAVTITGGTMPGVAISIDDKNGKATFSWLDDHNEPTNDIPVSPDGGAINVTLASDNPSVATLAADPTNANTFDIAPVAAGGLGADGNPDGTVNVVVSAADDQGNPVSFANGEPVQAPPTPFGIKPGPAGTLAVAVSA